MKKWKFTQTKGVVVFEFVIIVVALSVIGFASFIRTNSQQRANVEPVSQEATQAQESKLTVDSVRPIVSVSAITDAEKQLASLEAERTEDTCMQNLLSDIDSIANQ